MHGHAASLPAPRRVLRPSPTPPCAGPPPGPCRSPDHSGAPACRALPGRRRRARPLPEPVCVFAGRPPTHKRPATRLPTRSGASAAGGFVCSNAARQHTNDPRPATRHPAPGTRHPAPGPPYSGARPALLRRPARPTPAPGREPRSADGRLPRLCVGESATNTQTPRNEAPDALRCLGGWRVCVLPPGSSTHKLGEGDRPDRPRVPPDRAARAPDRVGACPDRAEHAPRTKAGAHKRAERGRGRGSGSGGAQVAVERRTRQAFVGLDVLGASAVDDLRRQLRPRFGPVPARGGEPVAHVLLVVGRLGPAR